MNINYIFGSTIRKYRISWFCKVVLVITLVSSFTYAQTGNYVFSGREAANYGVVNLATPGGQAWTTDRGLIPGYFSAIGTASYTGGSDLANINGYVKHYANAANQSFSFPVGTGTDYRVLSVSGTRSATSVVGVAWILGNPSNTPDPTAPNAGTHPITALGIGLTGVSPVGMWDWQDISADAAGLTVTVSIPDLSSFASSAADLRLVGWDGTNWINLSGSSGATGLTENSTLSGTMKAGITALAIGKGLAPSSISLTNTCPANSVNLSTAVSLVGTLPSNTIITWHTSLPATNANIVTNTTAVLAGTYYGAIKDTLNNCFSPALSTVTVSITPCCPTITNTLSNNINPSSCNSSTGSIKLCGLIANGTGYTVNYDKNGIAATALTNQIADASGCINITGLTAGSYTNIRVSTINCQAGSNTLSATLTDPVIPSLTSTNFTHTNPTACASINGTIKICGLEASSMYSIVYNKNGAVQTAVNANTDASGCVTISNLSSGTYDNFVVRNTITTCSSNVIGVSVVLSDPVTATISIGASQNPSACGLNDGFIQMSGLVSGTQYTLNYMLNGTGLTPVVFTASGSTYTISNLTSGNYTGITVSSLGCTSNALSKVLSDPITATISLSAKTNPTACSANDGSFTLTGLAPSTSYILNYMKDGIAQTPVSFTSTGVSYTLSGLTRGDYTNIRVTSSGCVSNSVSTSLNDPGAVILSLGTPTQPSACGVSDGTITLSGLVVGNTYVLRYKKNGIWQSSSTVLASTTSYTITGLGAGSYTNIAVTQGGCTSNSLSQVLSDPGAALLSLGTITQVSSCGATDGSITLSGLTTGLSYILNYTKDGIAQGSISFTATGSSYIMSGLGAGQYRGINVTQGGCTSSSLNTQISNPGGAIIDVIGLNPVTCTPGNDGGLIITGLSQGLSYVLNYMKNGVAQTPISIVSTPSTSYKINGLVASSYTNITVAQASCLSNVVSETLLSPAITTVPSFGVATLTNICPSPTADLTDLTATNLPVGLNVTWHSGSVATSVNKIADPTSIGAGQYYASYYNATTLCYSPTALITVSIAPCDSDGDGDPDSTDPQPTNACVWSANQVLANTSTTWRNADCDGDGVTNYKEVTGTDNNPATTADNTNPLDGCSYNAVDQVLSSTSVAWKLLDCDKDGNPNGTDPNPKTPTAVADEFTAKYGSATGFNILANDDFRAGLSTSLSKTGGTANGTVSFNTLTGVLTYTPTLAERGTTVTVTYQVCNTGVTPNVCASATVTITVPVDTDADGVPDIDDLDDDNDGILDTVENAQLSADTDGDGIPNRLDLDSDNDGINDVDEANGVDADGDGMADGLVSPTGIPSTAGLGLTPPDTDNDNKPNPYDLDSDNDGVTDLEESGLNPNLDANGDGIVDCTTNCDPDGDGILTPVDGLPNVWKDALLPDLTPTTEINSLEFLTAGTSRDFVVNVYEINDKPNVAGSTIGFRVAKISGFTITYSNTSGTSNVFGGTANSNSDWTFTENANFITVTAKPGVVIPQNGQKTIGFTVARKTGVPSNTSQNITVTIIYGSAGEERVNNNTVETKITAN